MIGFWVALDVVTATAVRFGSWSCEPTLTNDWFVIASAAFPAGM